MHFKVKTRPYEGKEWQTLNIYHLLQFTDIMKDKKTDGPSIKINFEVEALEVRDGVINGGRIVGLSQWDNHRVKIIILPEVEIEPEAVQKFKEKKELQRQEEALSETKMDKDEPFKKLKELKVMSAEEINATMYYDVICTNSKCNQKTRAFFTEVAIGKKRAWVRVPCPKCGHKMQFQKDPMAKE
jgi:hypothetical protein